MMSARIFQPRLPTGALQRLLTTLSQAGGRALVATLREGAALARTQDGPSSLVETAIHELLADLTMFGWQFRVVRSNVFMIPRRVEDIEPLAAKASLRKALSGTREQQLAEPSTAAFLREMHKPKTRQRAISSIESVIDDGSSLAATIAEARTGDLSHVVKPYLQFFNASDRCQHTGILLNDMWRYFRHTWSTEFRPVPGRNLNYLVRNAARRHHPVMGIVGMANAIFQLTTRDEWVGWTERGVVERALHDPAGLQPFINTAIQALVAARALIRSDDLLKEIGKPKSALEEARRLERLAKEHNEARKKDLRDREVAEDEDAFSPRSVFRTKSGSVDWEKASESPLFKRKRAETLAGISFALHYLTKATKKTVPIASLAALVATPDGYKVEWADAELGKAIRTAVREIKKNGVSSRILDVNVCGAAPAYRELLGGKLAAMSLFSSEVQDEYLKRYADSPAEIASAMAGRPVSKASHICALTTTSLYEVGSSQYNRVRVRFGDRTLQWSRIGETEGFGAIHFSKPTIEAVRRIAVAHHGLRNVNNVFGEGTSPLMRQIREGVSLIGFEPNDVLHHSQKRIVYAAEIYPEAREDLLANRDSYSRGPSFSDIAAEWQSRWLKMRVSNDDALSRMSAVTIDSIKSDLAIREESPEEVLT